MSEAFVVEGDGVACGMRRADGGSVGTVNVQCGVEMGASAACTCGKNGAGQLQLFCTGGCDPSMQSLCVTTNCGDIDCGSGATCVARGHCAASPAPVSACNTLDGGLSEAFVIEGDGVACGMRRADGGSVGTVNVQCGAEAGTSAACTCGKNGAGQLQLVCTGGCDPSMQPLCVTTNCGDIDCGSGATCVGRGHCEG